jgi:hypothetical protein
MRTASITAALIAAAALLSPAAQVSADVQWTDVPVPLPAGAVAGELEDITAIAANDAWAVGSWRDTVDHPLAVHWDGTRWTSVPVDDSAAPGRYRLTAVDAVASGDVWAAGSITSANPGGQDTALVLHFTNGAWQAQRLDPMSVVAGTLHGIDMVSATEGWAVGKGTTAGIAPRPVVLHYQSGAWTETAIQAPAGAQLTSVFGSPNGPTWAVGSHTMNGSVQRPLIVQWDGATWRTVVTTIVGPAIIVLNRVGGWSTADAWAVGTACDPSRPPFSCDGFVMHLSGGVWSTVRGASADVVTGVAADSPTSVWLAGYAESAATVDTDTDHLEQWDGSGPTGIHLEPNETGQMGSALASAATDHAGGIWAVGWCQQTDATKMPSALHRTGVQFQN